MTFKKSHLPKAMVSPLKELLIQVNVFIHSSNMQNEGGIICRRNEGNYYTLCKRDHGNYHLRGRGQDHEVPADQGHAQQVEHRVLSDESEDAAATEVVGHLRSGQTLSSVFEWQQNPKLLFYPKKTLKMQRSS